MDEQSTDIHTPWNGMIPQHRYSKAMEWNYSQVRTIHDNAATVCMGAQSTMYHRSQRYHDLDRTLTTQTNHKNQQNVLVSEADMQAKTTNLQDNLM
jgi:hypothetical protein